MAIGYLPQPGSGLAPGEEYGPCSEPCRHPTCEASREMFAAVCTGCGKPLEDRGFYDEYYDQEQPTGRHNYYIHTSCFYRKHDITG